MIPGISASSCSDHSLEVARARLLEAGWPWLGEPGPRSTRLLRLPRCGCDEILVRVYHEGPERQPSWRVVFEAADGPTFAVVLDCVLTIEPFAPRGIRLAMRGKASATLAGTRAHVPRSAVRLAANACARSFLDHVIDVWTALSVPRRSRVVADRGRPAS